MARYTLNLSEVCETMTGQHFDNLTGNAFDRIDTISEAALPLLFSDRYDLLDNDTDRETLEKMILEHYWEYEVCTYTPSDFILRLNRKLREIAPLYNQRYASAKMEYPVFDDVNYTRVSTNNDTYNETSGGVPSGMRTAAARTQRHTAAAIPGQRFIPVLIQIPRPIAVSTM